MYIQIFLVLIYILFAKKVAGTNRFVKTVLLFFVVLYGAQIVFAVIDPYNIYTIHIGTIVLFNLQILFLLLGALEYNRNIKTIKRPVNINRIFDIQINSYVIVVQTILLVLAIRRFQQVAFFLKFAAATSNEARSFYYNELYQSYTEMLLNQIVEAFTIVSYFLSFGLLFFHNKKLKLKEWYVALSGLLIIVLNTISSSGRSDIIQVLVVFLLFFFFSKSFDKDVYSRKVLPTSIVFLPIIVVVFGIITMNRSNLDETEMLYENVDTFILKPFITYLYGPVCAFEYGSQNIFGDLVPMFGAADLASIIDVLVQPITYFDHSITGINSILGERMTPRFSFPSGETWNALFTGASNYYIDFSYFGFIICPFIHGYLLSLLCNRCKYSGVWFIVLIFLFRASFIHIGNSGIQSMSTVFAFFWIWTAKKFKVVT